MMILQGDSQSRAHTWLYTALGTQWVFNKCIQKNKVWGGGLCCWWFWVGNFCNTHLGYMGDNNKTQESHCLGVSQIVKSVGHLPSSFCLSWFCCACVIWYQGFLAKR